MIGYSFCLEHQSQTINRKRTKSRSVSRDSDHNTTTTTNHNIQQISSEDQDSPMYDPTGKTSPLNPPKIDIRSISKKDDLILIIQNAIEQISTDGNMTKSDIRSTFMDFRNKLTQREMKLLHDVDTNDTTVDKKTRLLQTQLEYISNGNNTNELACDPSMSLNSKEEQEMQDR